MMKISVRNLPFNIGEKDLRELFEPFGEVFAAQLMMDRHTGRPLGHGLVEMSEEDGETAINSLHGRTFHNRELQVNQSVTSGGGGRFRW